MWPEAYNKSIFKSRVYRTRKNTNLSDKLEETRKKVSGRKWNYDKAVIVTFASRMTCRPTPADGNYARSPPVAAYRFFDFYREEAIANPSSFLATSRTVRPIEKLSSPRIDRMTERRFSRFFFFFRTYRLSDARITGSGIRSRSSRNVFVMPADAYLSYIRFHHEGTRLVDFEIKLPPRADQHGERKKARGTTTGRLERQKWERERGRRREE